MPKSKKAPVIAIIGAGRVGRALGRLLRQRGWRIGAVVTRSSATARAAARAIGAGTPHLRLDASVLASDVVLITVPDRSIASVARELASLTVVQGAHHAVRRGALRPVPNQRKGIAFNWRGKIVLHTCGALDRGVLRPLEHRGAATGSLHPLQTFGRVAERKSPVRGAFKVRDTLPQLKGVACAIEGSPKALRAAQRIARELGCIPIRVPGRAKPSYHAAAVFAAGHILGVIEAATRILMAAGFSRRQAVQALLPLTRQTLINFERTGVPAAGSRALVAPAAIWTGPAARGDLATVRMHQAALRQFPREYRTAYAALTRLSILLLTI